MSAWKSVGLTGVTFEIGSFILVEYILHNLSITLFIITTSILIELTTISVSSPNFSGAKPRKGASAPVLSLEFDEDEEEEEEESGDDIGSPAKRTKSRSPKSAQLMNKVRTKKQEKLEGNGMPMIV